MEAELEKLEAGTNRKIPEEYRIDWEVVTAYSFYGQRALATLQENYLDTGTPEDYEYRLYVIPDAKNSRYRIIESYRA